MGNLKITRCYLFCILNFLFLAQVHVLCFQYKVGDLDSWGMPNSANSLVYSKWVKNKSFKIGDSLLFLYPPSEDSVIQVTEESYNSCNTKNPILYMNNGNSLFNVTQNGVFYFTSGQSGHCQKKQKIRISVGSVNGSAAADSPFYGPEASAPSYPKVFGSIPLPETSSSPGKLAFPVVVGLAVIAIVGSII